METRSSVGSLSQFGPSCAVSLKIRLLTTPHSGLSMKRNDRMVGIDGTAHGRMNTTESLRIHAALVDEEAGQEQGDHLQVDVDRPDQERSVLTTAVRKNTGSSPELDVALRSRASQRPYPTG